MPQLATALYPNLITQTSANANTIVQAPLTFVRGGRVDPVNILDNAGFGGYYWSSVGSSRYYAYYLALYSGYVTPSYDVGRYFGFPIRCVALGG